MLEVVDWVVLRIADLPVPCVFQKDPEIISRILHFFLGSEDIRVRKKEFDSAPTKKRMGS
jgi:hypothetical protein